MKEFMYERNKIKMKGYVAVQQKLLVILYIQWKKGQSFEKPQLHLLSVAE
jgi:hypothetical protein